MPPKVKKPVKIIGERDIELHLSNTEHHEQITKIAKALSSPIRLNILNLLKNTALSLQEIAGILRHSRFLNRFAYKNFRGSQAHRYRDAAGTSWLYARMHMRYAVLSP